MTSNEYNTTAEMLADHPGLRVTAVRFRVRRLLASEAIASAEAGADALPLIARWHELQASEAKPKRVIERHADRRPSVHRTAMRAARRREAAAYPAPVWTSS